MSGCDSCAPVSPSPLGWTLDAIASAPAYRHLLEPGARCELAAAHDGPHRNGGLIWHAPPIVVNRPPADDAPVVFAWER